MSSCGLNNLTQAYHDGQLDADAARRFESHLDACGACKTELASLRSISQLFMANFPPIEMPQAAMDRLHVEINILTERSLLRWAMSFASVAAVVLVAATIGLLQLHQPSFEAPQPWEGSAIAMQTSTSSSSAGDASNQQEAIDADLILADLSQRAKP